MIYRARRIAKCVVVNIPSYLARKMKVDGGTQVEVREGAGNTVYVKALLTKTQLKEAQGRHKKELSLMEKSKLEVRRANAAKKSRTKAKAAKKSPIKKSGKRSGKKAASKQAARKKK